jgi:hypothetical protein
MILVAGNAGISTLLMLFVIIPLLVAIMMGMFRGLEKWDAWLKRRHSRQPAPPKPRAMIDMWRGWVAHWRYDRPRY